MISASGTRSAVPGGEGLGDGERAQDEVGVGRDERQAQLGLAEVVQREERLDPGDAAAGDDDAQRLDGGHASSVGSLRHRAIRNRP